jgi:hypothetical protein
MFSNLRAYLETNPVDQNDLVLKQEYVLLGALLKKYDSENADVEFIKSQLQDLAYDDDFIGMLCCQADRTQTNVNINSKLELQVKVGPFKFRNLKKIVTRPSNIIIFYDETTNASAKINFQANFGRKFLVTPKNKSGISRQSLTSAKDIHNIFIMDICCSRDHADIMKYMDLVVFLNLSSVLFSDMTFRSDAKIIAHMLDTLKQTDLDELHSQFLIRPGSLPNYDFHYRITTDQYRSFNYVLWQWMPNEIDCLNSLIGTFSNLKKLTGRGVCICSDELAVNKYLGLFSRLTIGHVCIKGIYSIEQSDAITFVSKSNLKILSKCLHLADFAFTLELDILSNFDIGNCLEDLGKANPNSQLQFFAPYYKTYADHIVTLYEIIEDIHCIPETEAYQDMVVNKLFDRITNTIANVQFLDLVLKTKKATKLVGKIHLHTGFNLVTLEPDIFAILDKKYPKFEESGYDIEPDQQDQVSQAVINV